MRILLLVTKAEVGGAQQVVRNLACGLHEHGHTVTVGYGGDGDFLLRELGATNVSTHQFQHLSRSRNPFQGLRFARELYRFLQGQEYDVVHMHSANTLYGVLAAWWYGVASVFTFHGMSVLAEGYAVNPVMKYMYAAYFALFSRLLDTAVYLTEADMRTAESWYISPAERAVIPNGIDFNSINYYTAKKARSQLSERTSTDLSDRLIVGSIGRLAYAKNYQLLVRAAKPLADKFPDLAVVIVGGGPQKAELQKCIQENDLEDSVYLAGPIPQAAKLIPAFDVFTLTSRYEGLPITIIEALGAGVPIVAPDVGGVSEVVVDNQAQLFPAGDKQALAGKLSKLLADQDKRHKLSMAQQGHAQEFTTTNMISAHHELYHTVIR